MKLNDNLTNGDASHGLEPIAIVGIGLRLPGKIHTAESLWRLLINKDDTRGPVPQSRYNSGGFYSASARPGTTGVRHGHFLDESDGLGLLDTSFFTMGKLEVEKLDPQQRMLLEVVWECMENGGQRDWRGTNTGVFVGTWGDDWLDFLAKDPQQTGGMLNVSGAGDFAISNRISYEYDLRGPSVTIKAACASTMICLHQACQSLRNGDCDAAIVAGTNLIITPTQTIAQTEAGVLSPTGQCRTFDVSANGYARGEAVNAILIKRLSNAVLHRDPIRGVVRSTSVNCDGRSAGISSPNPEAHERMIKHAYRMAGITNITDTPFVEVHGTGTPSGDPLELQAISNVFGPEQETYVGSVKANVGHGEGASGLTSIIKAVLALENRIIPPQVNFSTPNPKIPFKEARLIVPINAIPWPANRPERVSVNSFGITGANAHAIIESARSYIGKQDAPSSKTVSTPNTGACNLLVFSANCAKSLSGRVTETDSYLAAYPDRLSDLAYTLACRREFLPYRAYRLIRGTTAGDVFSAERLKEPSPSVNFVFTGQGAQWPCMAKELIEQYSGFREDMAHFSNVLTQLPHPPAWSLLEELLKPVTESRLNDPELAQPLCTAIQVAFVNLLRRLGIFPAAVVGHSSGEIAAAYSANAITADEAIIIAYYRGLVTVGSSREGAMAAVGLGKAEAALYLERGVVVACDNSPSSVTLSGDREALETVIGEIHRDDEKVFVRRLKTNGMAYHSHHMLPLGPVYEGYLNPLLRAQPPSVPFFSSVTGKCASHLVFDSGYWRENLESPVKFFQAVNALMDGKNSPQLFLEIGPHSALAGPMRQIFANSTIKGRRTYLASLVRGADAVECLLEMIGQLYLKSVPVQLEHLALAAGRTLTDMPNYPWHHEKVHWVEPRVIKEWRTRQFPPHELLGSRVLEGNNIEPMWRHVLRLKDVPWLRHHKVLDDVVFPCAGYVGIIGEAIRQVTGAEDFTIRRLNISTALILSDEKTAEIITSLKPQRSATDSEAVWYEVTICSHNGSTWTTHCDGQACGGSGDRVQPKSKLSMAPLPRKVRSPYGIFDRVGLHYGPTFQGIEAVSVSPGYRTATASLQAPPVTGSSYSLHPTTIDQCLQLLGLAASEGLSRHLDHILLPTGIEHIYIQAGQAQEALKATAVAKAAGKTSNTIGQITVAKNDCVILSAHGCALSAFRQTFDDDKDSRIAAARLSWRPDLDFVQIDSLMRSPAKDLNAIRVVETYVLVCTIEMQHRIQESGCSPAGHMKKFRQWIDNHIEKSRDGHNKVVPNSQELCQLKLEDRLALIRCLQDELRTSEFVHVAELITRLLDNCTNVFLGETQILDVYLRDNGLTKMYAITGDRIDSSEFFFTVGHSNPRMRVLEIGAGTGGTTLVALQSLHTISGERMYANYTFTDISSGFFTAARERFAQYSGLEFKTLDIGKDPLEQGFEAGEYDLIIASNVIHATPCLNTTLKNVRKLLHRRGYFFLQELIPSSAKMINLIMGPLSGWWLGESDDRQWEPIVSTERWNRELLAAGFSGIEAVVHDDPQPDGVIGVNMIARPTQPAPDYCRITLLILDSQRESQAVRIMLETLVNHGFQADQCILGEAIPAYQDIISLLEVDCPFVGSMSEGEFLSLQAILKNPGASRIFWVMGPAQFGPTIPEYGLTLGFARSVRAELSVPLATFEIDEFNLKAAETALKVFRKFQDTAASVNPEHEFVLKENIVHVGRYHWTKVSEELATLKVPPGQPLRLEKIQAGRASMFKWVPVSPSPLGPNDVLVSPAYAGITFKDKLAGASNSNHILGFEGSGTIAAIGRAVQTLKVGDRVMMLGPGCLHTIVTIPSHQVVRIPDSMSFEEAATIPLGYATAIHCVKNIANLQRSQTILIHSACGDVGLAALRISLMIGAQVYCTVRNSEEADYLAETLSVPREHIFLSREATFMQSLMHQTSHRGVDVVLNSQPRDSLYPLWQCVARRGKMIELGNGDFSKQNQLDLGGFLASNRSFIGVDITDLQDMYQGLLSEIVTLHDNGLTTPPSPIQVFDANEFTNVANTMSEGEGVGKCVVRMAGDYKNMPVGSVPPQLELRGDASYILVGGLGGLGQAISTCLVEHGARHLIYLSRTAGSSEDHADFFRELESQGCSVQVFSGDVGVMDDVQRVVRDAEHPIAGVLQMAMILKDRPFLNMCYDEWRTALNPKVDGTWNLHNALLESKLDFFVIFGSISGSFGIAHQANYAAANTFQDAFVQYRHAHGLPASILNIGAMADIGYVSQRQSVQDYFKAAGMPFLSEADLFETLHLSISQQFPAALANQDGHPIASLGFCNMSQLALGIRATKPMDDPSNRVLWKFDRRVDIYRNLEASRSDTGDNGTQDNEEDGLITLVKETRSDPSVLEKPESLEMLTREIGINIYRFMLRPVEELDVSKSLMALGVDSLIMIEIRNWLRQRLEVETSTLEILNGGTIEALGKIVAQRLKEKYGGVVLEPSK